MKAKKLKRRISKSAREAARASAIKESADFLVWARTAVQSLVVFNKSDIKALRV